MTDLAGPAAAGTSAGVAGTGGRGPVRPERLIDLDAIAANVAAVRGLLRPDTALMAVVKADGYGHGMLDVARTALAAGADWLGVAVPAEALALRAAGITAPVLCWLTSPGDDPAPLIDADIDIAVSAGWRLREVTAAAGRVGRRARVQVKVDTGLGRNGVTTADLPELLGELRAARAAGLVEPTGIWSHLARADEPGHPATDAQRAVFVAAIEQMRAAGIEPGLRHLANSAATLTRPDTHFDLVRIGLALYGYAPMPVPAVRLTPAMTVRAGLAGVKPVDAGQGVSYGHDWYAPAPTTLGLLPIGYADGILRACSPGAQAWVNGRRVPLVGRVCMDQVVLDLGPNARDRPGDEVVMFGPGGHGEPTADDWAQAAGTISYEILTGIRGRVGLRATGGPATRERATGERVTGRPR